IRASASRASRRRPGCQSCAADKAVAAEATGAAGHALERLDGEAAGTAAGRARKAEIAVDLDVARCTQIDDPGPASRDHDALGHVHRGAVEDAEVLGERTNDRAVAAAPVGGRNPGGVDEAVLVEGAGPVRTGACRVWRDGR